MFLFEHILVIASRSSREKKLKKKLQQKKLGWWRNNYNFKSFLINIIRLRFREQPIQGASNWKCNKYLQDLGVGCYRFYDNIDNELWSNLETLYNFPIFRFDLQFDINGLRSSIWSASTATERKAFHHVLLYTNVSNDLTHNSSAILNYYYYYYYCYCYY